MSAPLNTVSRRALMLGFVTAGILRASSSDKVEPAPHFHAKTLDGEKFNNDSVKGKVVLLQFWATWCPYCRREQPVVDTLHTEFKDKGLVILAVDVGESKKKVRKYLDDSPRQCPIVLTEDTNLAAMFSATMLPVYVVIDRDGNIVGTQRGAAGEEALRRMLAKAGLESEWGIGWIPRHLPLGEGDRQPHRFWIFVDGVVPAARCQSPSQSRRWREPAWVREREEAAGSRRVRPLMAESAVHAGRCSGRRGVGY